jgi:hypothetical protein
MSDNGELNELLAAPATRVAHLGGMVKGDTPELANSADEQRRKPGAMVQWTTADEKTYFPASHTREALPPGAYEIGTAPGVGLYFEKIPVRTEGLLRFPQTNSERIVREIQTFWEREDKFRTYGLNYQRGILTWGPPGAGKSCTSQLLMADVIDRGGVVVKFDHPKLFVEGMRIFRNIQPATPAVVLMEDIDNILERYSESDVLNVLDGVDRIDKVVYLASTNYPERLGARIVNRPSRFDKRFKIGHPNDESRRIYISHLVGGAAKAEELEIDLGRWVADTEGFSLAHLKELFVAVVILGDDYAEAVETLSTMKEIQPSSDRDEERPMGFRKKKAALGWMNETLGG